ncbi:MAG: hypothetical protein IPG47_12995 [Thermoflexaceae bacterium]|nr:hypothetical protein [Thermoflexaceae bacterium]
MSDSGSAARSAVSKRTLVTPAATAPARAFAIALAARSMPTNRLPGRATARGMRLPPSPQPASSTKASFAPAAGTPNSRAIASMRTGDVEARAVDTYGTSS